MIKLAEKQNFENNSTLPRFFFNVCTTSSEENPGNWQNNPNLSTVCTDDNELSIIQEVLSFNGFSTEIATSDCLLGIKDNLIADFNLNPNPTASTFIVSSASAFENIKVFDALGRCVFASDALSLEKQIDASAWQSGFYLIQALVNGKPVFSKLVRR